MRYLPLTESDRLKMLEAIGVAAVDDLFADIPEAARLKRPLDLPLHKSEIEVERAFQAMAAKNLSPAATPSFLGAGAYRHHIPACVDHLIQRSEFLTTYTPYQPEIAQGTLQHLFEFQTQVALLTGMEVANASMYDGASACAEAVLMAKRLTGRAKTVLSGGLHPHYRAVCRTFAGLGGNEVKELPYDVGGGEDAASTLDRGTAGLVVQYPDVFGRIRDLKPLAQACQTVGALLIVAVTECIALGALLSPGEMGADIVVAEGQSLGVPLSFGGPYLGLFASREKFVRQMPGRICGETVDKDGRRSFVLTLSAREQHIRREKATSNICTNSGLCALAFSIHLALLGESGFSKLARLNHALAVSLAERLAALPGVELIAERFFNEFTLRLPKPAEEVVERLATRGILAGVPMARLMPEANADRLLLLAVTECNTENDFARLIAALQAELQSC
jgi:glycine dehydrogenase subunit 1